MNELPGSVSRLLSGNLLLPEKPALIQLDSPVSVLPIIGTLTD
jgi:hypothetical protein